jgi:hypothetical protein
MMAEDGAWIDSDVSMEAITYAVNKRICIRHLKYTPLLGYT